MQAVQWEFWIDVGGTFTDCIARRPDGQLVRHKLLSSARTKGRVGDGASNSVISDNSRTRDPDGFWRGFRLQLLDTRGSVVGESRVQRFDPESGRLALQSPLPYVPDQGQPYELISPDPAPILAVRYILGLGLHDPIPRIAMRLGTTRGTNALITRRGAKTAFVTTKGFGDILRIGYQDRPRLFDLHIQKREPLESSVVEIDERLTPDGQVLVPLDQEAVRDQLGQLIASGIESVAICLLHSYAQPRHEEIVAGIAEEVGFREISTSHGVSPLMKLVPRGDTTVVDAYLNPVLRSYLAGLQEAVGPSDIRVLTSAGGLAMPDRYLGKDSILSGPAGGVVGFSRASRAAGFTRAIGFDMGGTSTDVSRFDGRFELQFENEKDGVRVVTPMLAIETVAAGGGSICAFDGVQLHVGPDSAGAEPGPACYGRGGPLAVTDVNFYLGRILPDHFPFQLEYAAVDRHLRDLCAHVASATGQQYTTHELADGFLKIANANMIKAIRTISIAKGCNPQEYVLVAFGGAAPQHACSVARQLQIPHVLIHPDASILSAYGIGLAEVVRHRVQGIYQAYCERAVADLNETVAQLAAEAAAEVVSAGIDRRLITTTTSLDLRYEGLDSFLTIQQPDEGTYADAFTQTHQRLYGYTHQGRQLEIVAVRVEAVGRTAQPLDQSVRVRGEIVATDRAETIYFDGVPRQAAIFSRGELQPGHRVEGPALIVDPVTTILVEADWCAELLSDGQLLLSDQGTTREEAGSTAMDPVTLELFNNQFVGIAQQMGVTLRNTASSVNVKERLDFSCAIFTAEGDLVVNAPHIPVHLGAMSQTVCGIIQDHPTISAGDVFVTNDPYRGGSHLPDITVVTPIHDSETGQLLFFTASRAHHAEIGGIVPGSMPPFSKNLAEEGVLIRSMKVMDAGRSNLDRLRQLLLSGDHPTRNVEDNLADISAQIAANHQGAIALRQMVENQSVDVVLAYMRHIQSAAERKMRKALSVFPDGEHSFVDHLDDGSPIRVKVTVQDDRATIDFTGTAAVLASNLNANRAIVTAAVMYCLRCLMDEDIPMNEGMLAPIDIILPECLLNPPERPSPAQCAAVVGGNVETSQRVVDVLLGAFGLAAASQGTMNNVLFGDNTFGYYETICGGAGATAHGNGADAVHTHMTNTRITDPEILEQRYGVRVLEFSIRPRSGGIGFFHGGDGVIRRLQFTRPLDVSIVSQRRGPYAPYGINEGQPGQLGRNTLLRFDGTSEKLSGQAQFRVESGDILVIETPGGGGFGRNPVSP